MLNASCFTHLSHLSDVILRSHICICVCPKFVDVQGQSNDVADAGCSGQTSVCTKLSRAGVGFVLLGSQISAS